MAADEDVGNVVAAVAAAGVDVEDHCCRDSLADDLVLKEPHCCSVSCCSLDEESLSLQLPDLVDHGCGDGGDEVGDGVAGGVVAAAADDDVGGAAADADGVVGDVAAAAAAVGENYLSEKELNYL